MLTTKDTKDTKVKIAQCISLCVLSVLCGESTQLAREK